MPTRDEFEGFEGFEGVAEAWLRDGQLYTGQFETSCMNMTVHEHKRCFCMITAQPSDVCCIQVCTEDRYKI